MPQPGGDARADLSPVEFKAEASFEGGEDVAGVLIWLFTFATASESVTQCQRETHLEWFHCYVSLPYQGCICPGRRYGGPPRAGGR